LLNQGDKILTQGNLYGGTTELIKNVIKRYGIEAVFVNLRDDTEIEAALKQHPEIKMVYFETPSNPSLDCIDMAHMTAIAREYGLISVVDNTFSTPILQQPFKYGVDFIVHSTTKYLNGHGNSVAGIIIGSGKEDWEKVWKTMKLIGTNCNPFDAWLTNMGMKTLAVRMKQHCENGMLLAQFLEDHPKVRDVRYLGLPEHPDHSLAVRQMNGYSGMLCFELEGGLEEGKKFMNAQSIGALAPTLGDVDTLILHPASMSHLNVDKDIRMRNGISDGLIRVSVGLEDITDLTEDFDRALGQI
jgi:methionine-gamma-lyase